jgi:hypothetical protein
MELSVSLKIDDIIIPGFKGSEDDSCYEKQHINRLKSMRFPNYIPTEMGESGKLDLPFFVSPYPVPMIWI